MEEELVNDPNSKVPTRKEWHGFILLLCVQAQNAMNEKAAQFLLLPLGAALAAEGVLRGGDNLKYILATIILLPYLILSPFVGWLADRFCKTRIVQTMAFMQIFVMAGMLYSLYNENIHGAVCWFAVFAVQATILSPARKGIVKDMLGVKNLGFSSGLNEIVNVFALLMGQIGVFYWISVLNHHGYMGWDAAIIPTKYLMFLAIPVGIFSLFIPRYAPLEAKPFKWTIFYEHFAQIKTLWADRRTRLSEIGISFFWFYAGVLLLIVLQLTDMSGAKNYSLVGAILNAWLTGGLVVGGALVSILSRRGVELGTIPLGAVGMTISCFVLSFLPEFTLSYNIGLACSGFFGGFFLIPLNGFLIDSSSNEERGNIIAAGNFIDMSMGLVAVGFQLFLTKSGVSIAHQFLIMSGLCALIAVLAFRLIPREFIKMIGLWVIKLVYRPRVINADFMPKTGGVLLVSNHVSLFDAIFLTIANERPIRFIVAEEYITVKILGWVLELFNSVPISNKKPREALHIATEALLNGEVICIFPEGQLTRMGVMTKIRRGFEIIAKRANAPIIPVYMDNIWGYWMSYRGGALIKFPRHFSHHFSIVYGEALDASTVSEDDLREVYQKLSSFVLKAVGETGRSAIRQALERQKARVLVRWSGGEWRAEDILRAFLESRTPVGDGVGHRWMRLFIATLSDTAILEKVWANAAQMTRVHALKPGAPLLTLLDADEPYENVISVFYALMTHTPVYILTDEEAIPEGIKQVVGGIKMRDRLARIIPLSDSVLFYDFSGNLPQKLPNISVRSCLSSPEGVVISMSMQKEVYVVDEEFVQYGLKYKSYGMLLPGFISELDTATHGLSIRSDYLEDSIVLPEGLRLDEDNFIRECNN